MVPSNMPPLVPVCCNHFGARSSFPFPGCSSLKEAFLFQSALILASVLVLGGHSLLAGESEEHGEFKATTTHVVSGF